MANLTINLRKIVKNYQAIVKHVGNQVKVASVVKCNCYGLGMEQIAPALFKAGCKEFYVAELSEGLACRVLLKTAEIYVLNGIEAGDEKEFLKANLIPVLNNLHQIAIWTKAAKKCRKRLKSALHIDTGMTRIGIDPYLVDAAISSVLKDNRLEVCYIISHLACPGDARNKMNSRQLDFMKFLQNKYPEFKYSFSSSLGIALGKTYHFDQVRPGIALYGDAVELTAKIIDIHIIQDNEVQKTVGYNATYKLKPGMVTATIPVGYGDGYSRRLSNVGICYINGTKVKVIGNISMDLTCLDISNLPKALQKIGQEVELIGNDISIEKIARLADTVNYEILTSLGRRYVRKYIN